MRSWRHPPMSARIRVVSAQSASIPSSRTWYQNPLCSHRALLVTVCSNSCDSPAFCCIATPHESLRRSTPHSTRRTRLALPAYHTLTSPQRPAGALECKNLHAWGIARGVARTSFFCSSACPHLLSRPDSGLSPKAPHDAAGYGSRKGGDSGYG